MSVALQVFLLVAAIVVAVAGIGVALALRMSSSQRSRRDPRKDPAMGTAMGTAHPRKPASNVVPLPRTTAAPRVASTASTMSVPTPPAAPQTPEEAHQAKLAALQALLALGDAKAAAGGQSGARFADTEPADDGYATTQFTDRSDRATRSSPLLNLDKLEPKRRRTQ